MQAIQELEPQVLNARVDAALAEIRETGFTVVPGLLAPEEADRLREALEEIVSAEAESSRRPSGHQRALYLAVKNPIFLEPLCHPFVLAVWRRYLGEDVICSSLSSNTLWPGCTEQYWHVDYPHWTMAEPYPTFPLAAQTLWMLDDFTEENGATAAIPGSHRMDHLPRMGSAWSDDAVILTGAKGSAILADGAFWHTSRPNRTDRFRSTLLIKYIRSFCIPQEDMRWQLSLLNDPPEAVRRLLGGDQYRPTRPGDPY
jgi:ectoine hydroxylase-related dioxygenase (phytanoyl-CoA dioxygenase family)